MLKLILFHLPEGSLSLLFPSRLHSSTVPVSIFEYLIVQLHLCKRTTSRFIFLVDFDFARVHLLQLSARSLRESYPSKYHSVLGDRFGQDFDSDHASSKLCISSSEAFPFRCRVFGSACCLGFSSTRSFSFSLLPCSDVLQLRYAIMIHVTTKSFVFVKRFRCSELHVKQHCEIDSNCSKHYVFPFLLNVELCNIAMDKHFFSLCFSSCSLCHMAAS